MKLTNSCCRPIVSVSLFILFWGSIEMNQQVCLAQLAQPTESKRMTPELLWKLGRLGNVAIDSTGNQLAYTVRYFDLAENKGHSNLMLLNLQTGENRLWLENWKSIGSLYWVQSNRGEELWFDGTAPADDSTESKSGESSEASKNEEAKADPAKKNQVYFMLPTASEPQPSTAYEEGVANFKMSPCGTRFAFSRRIKMDQTPKDIYPDLPKADARIIDQLMYRHWDSWHDYKYSHLHVANIDGNGKAGEPTDLMDGIRADSPVPPFGGTDQFDWSPDGKEIAFTMKDVPDWAESTNSDVFLIPVDEIIAPKNITPENLGYDNNPLYSPDGKWMVYQSMERAGFEADRNRLMLVDRETEETLELSAGLDQNVNHPHWLPDSSGLVFDSEIQGTVQLFTIDLDGQVKQLTDGNYNWQVAALSPDGRSVFASRMNMIYPHEIVQVSVEPNAVESGKVLTSINDSHFQDLELPTVEQRFVEATDGQQIHCWVIYPPNFDPTADKKWPLLTYCQGGPQSQVSQFFSYRWNFHLMAANDYIIVAVNRRGLPGFGQKWNDDISGDWGGQAMQDILSATDSMLAEPYIDKKRAAAIGASFGGYTVYWLMGNAEDRFCTMISHCGVFNLESMYGSTEELFFVNHDLGGPFWKSAEIQRLYDQFSPHRYVRNWKTPLLVIHGEKDFRVPITQGIEAFTAAQVQGVPSRFLYFPEEGHWVMGPQNGVLWHRVFFDWLDRFCKPQ